MTQATPTSPRQQFDSLRNQFGKQQGLPFLKILSRDLVEQACRLCNHPWRKRIYTPWITLGIFLSQILSDDHSCDDAVERFQKFRYDQGLPAVAPETSSYCEARQRLPEELTWDLVRRTGQAIHHQAEDAWLFHGRSVKVIDGSTVTLPDTPENQAAYPQLDSQAPGVGFPIARLLVVFSLAVGTVLEAALGPYQGKQTSELALLRQVLDQFQPGDIVLADRFFCSYWTIAALQARGVEIVVRLHQARTADFRRGRRLGREDHLVTWTKPPHVPGWMSRAESEAMPAQITVRELRIRVRDRTKRVRDLVIVTTLTDGTTYPAEELRSLFRQRWHAEVCQADCTPRCRLYPFGRPPHSGRGGAAEPGAMAPGRRQSIRGPQPCDATSNDPLPPVPRRPDTPRAPQPPLAGATGPDPARDAHHPQPDGDPGPATASGQAGGVA